MKTALVIGLALLLSLNTVTLAHDHCPAPPVNECKDAGPYPKEPDTSDCVDLAKRIKQAKSDIEELEISQDNLRMQLQDMADRDVTDAEIFLAQMIVMAIQVPGAGIKKAADVAKWVGEQLVSELVGGVMSEALDSGDFNIDDSFEGMSAADLSQLAAAVTAAIAMKYGELRTLETAIADCWRLKEVDLQAFDKAVEDWDLNSYKYENCMDAHKRAMRRWQRRCDE